MSNIKGKSKEQALLDGNHAPNGKPANEAIKPTVTVEPRSTFLSGKQLDADAPMLQKLEKTFDDDVDIAKGVYKEVSEGGDVLGSLKTGWKDMVKASGGSKIKAGSRLGAYAAGVAMVADLLNPLSPGWGD